MYKLMLIEDDIALSSLMKEQLESDGYQVFQSDDFKTILDDFKVMKPDLVLLDINLPYSDGYFLCRSMRKQSTIPIKIISGRSSEIDQMMAIELGADDYLTKPFTLNMLLTKVKAIIRRVYGDYAKQDASMITIDDLSMNTNTLTLTYQQNTVELSKNEMKILKKFMENNERYLTREELIEEVWDDITFVDDNTLTVNITRVKQKLASLGLPNQIKSKRGVGYLFQYQMHKR
ncbi:response regulator transcription factor [Halalkalibacterium halodurans]|uniref:response regulator transcription factor n=2 Tax=Halalkalibacterium halodurans TaxID=86665 RepID=UPI002E2349E4|nr:response regulator transcription factor [Halalkalibacterium halodurans]MED4086936.1 response regulator transcription factor [Halalkalibacterium halodurans]MED4107023.1 response regulator transcription factor [Halalkalibacterium halodurans]MED4110105.1 response regulator transcription factor [Halalkalibacterium halodurans]MED4124922.1 response regulator transcription factor [Halalkalibacterium halodurans]